MPANPNHVIANLRELAALTSDPNGAQRIAFTPTWQRARDWFATKLAALPADWHIEHHLDAAGNNWATLPGASPNPSSSAPTSTPSPTAAGSTAPRRPCRPRSPHRLARDTQRHVRPVTIRLVDWADEEGARFGRTLFGSSAFAGTHTIAADRARTDRDGITLEAALAACSIDIDNIGDAAGEREQLAAYLELHIEQGPVLERLGLPLAAVLGTKGVERHAITFHGQEAHSGSTPMSDRRDALAAAAKLALEIRTIASNTPTPSAPWAPSKPSPAS